MRYWERERVRECLWDAIQFFSRPVACNLGNSHPVVPGNFATGARSLSSVERIFHFNCWKFCFLSNFLRQQMFLYVGGPRVKSPMHLRCSEYFHLRGIITGARARLCAICRTYRAGHHKRPIRDRFREYRFARVISSLSRPSRHRSSFVVKAIPSISNTYTFAPPPTRSNQ